MALSFGCLYQPHRPRGYHLAGAAGWCWENPALDANSEILEVVGRSKKPACSVRNQGSKTELMQSEKQCQRERQRRHLKRWYDAGLGRKKDSDAMLEEDVEEASDRVERGGFRKAVKVLRILAYSLVAAVVMIAYILR